jgi:diacylglycerol kinase
MHTPHDTPKPFSIAARLRSFRHAFRGIGLFLRTAHNAWVQLVILAGVTTAGVMCALTQAEWLSIALAAGLVLTAEAFNTALEIDMNLTSPEFHPYARDTI